MAINPPPATRLRPRALRRMCAPPPPRADFSGRGKSRRIQDDDIERFFHAAQMGEGVFSWNNARSPAVFFGDGAAGTTAGPRRRPDDAAGARPGAIMREPSGVAKHVEHRLPGGQGRDRAPISPVDRKVAGLLARSSNRPPFDAVGGEPVGAAGFLQHLNPFGQASNRRRRCRSENDRRPGPKARKALSRAGISRSMPAVKDSTTRASPVAVDDQSGRSSDSP